ncbi:MAG: TetR/AcrR family transcriptional regulator [Pseudomonadota bacterium]
MGVGRHREFDKSEALREAMAVFWLHGYNATSMTHLTEAMGINKPSLYAAFGNKEKLFIAAIERYASEFASPQLAQLTADGLELRQRVRGFLTSVARLVTNPDLAGGCFIAASTSEMNGDGLPPQAASAVSEINAGSTDTLVAFFRDEQQRGNLGEKASPEALADYLRVLQNGLAVMARDKVSLDRLERLIDQAVLNF